MRISRCTALPPGSAPSPQCQKSVWVFRGPAQIALFDAPNSNLANSTRLQAFAIFADPFCFSDCRWESLLRYGEIKRTLFSTSTMIRAFHAPEGSAAGASELSDELGQYEVYVFHKDLPREELSTISTQADRVEAIQEMASRVIEGGFALNSTTWRVLLPKDSSSHRPEKIRLRETYRVKFLGVENETAREYVLARK